MTPHQSMSAHVRFPGATIAARELGVSRGHLHRVLTGKRESKALSKRWEEWLEQYPEFAELQDAALGADKARNLTGVKTTTTTKKTEQ